jgi:hypothetical protein
MTRDEFVNRYLTVNQADQLGSDAFIAHKHDCDNCAFMGSIVTIENRIGDIYVCSSHYGISFIIRFSSDGPDYASGDNVRSVIRYFH